MNHTVICYLFIYLCMYSFSSHTRLLFSRAQFRSNEATIDPSPPTPNPQIHNEIASKFPNPNPHLRFVDRFLCIGTFSCLNSTNFTHKTLIFCSIIPSFRHFLCSPSSNRLNQVLFFGNYV